MEQDAQVMLLSWIKEPCLMVAALNFVYNCNCLLVYSESNLRYLVCISLMGNTLRYLLYLSYMHGLFSSAVNTLLGMTVENGLKCGFLHRLTPGFLIHESRTRVAKIRGITR